jgi:hypothetical protein
VILPPPAGPTTSQRDYAGQAAVWPKQEKSFCSIFLSEDDVVVLSINQKDYEHFNQIREEIGRVWCAHSRLPVSAGPRFPVSRLKIRGKVECSFFTLDDEIDDKSNSQIRYPKKRRLWGGLRFPKIKGD